MGHGVEGPRVGGTGPGADRVLLGAAYYPEYLRPARGTGAAAVPPIDLVRRDLDLMAEAGFTAIRVGESVWSTWEPEDGRFDLDWLAPTLDEAHARGIDVVLGTPTYAVPMWLVRRHPEIAGDTATGRPMSWGSRQEVDFTHPVFRRHAERVIRAVVGRYLDHPAIVGYQVDNEPGIRLLFNDGVFARFVDHLRETYRDVETLNAEWGLVYWSHRLTDWADLWRPDGNLSPQYDLAWRRFQTSLVTEMIGWQADLVRSLVAGSHPERWVTTCVSMDQVGVADVPLAAELDVHSGNAYYLMGDTLAHPSDAPMSPDWVVRGTWGVHQLADLMWSARQQPFLVTETNASSIGHGSLNSVAYDGQWRQAAWALVARGARMVEYWHWHTLPYGTETFWGGVIGHDGVPGRAYRELARLGVELRAAGPVLARTTPDADVAFWYDTDAKLALSFATQAPLPGPTGWGDPDSYRRLVLPFYRGAFDAGLQVNTVRPEQLVGRVADSCGDPGARATEPAAEIEVEPGSGTAATSATPWPTDPATFAARRPVLVVVAAFTLRETDLDWLRAYAAAGGHLVIGPRTAFADHEGRVHPHVKPAGLAEAAGVSYAEWSNLDSPVPLTAPGLPGAAGGTATAWADHLRPEGAEVLLGYDHPHLGTWAAATTRAHGAGRITVVGTVPDQQAARALLAWAAGPATHGWTGLPASVRVLTATADDGSRVHVVHHWGWGEAAATTPVALADLLDPAVALPAGSPLTLGPWDVRVLREEGAR